MNKSGNICLNGLTCAIGHKCILDIGNCKTFIAHAYMHTQRLSQEKLIILVIQKMMCKSNSVIKSLTTSIL